MDDNIILKILSDYPKAWRDAKKFKALLLDYLPTDKITRNLINISIEENIPNDIFESTIIEKTQKYNYSKRLVNAVGCNNDDAIRIINMWVDAISTELPKSYFTSFSKLTEEQLTILNLPYEKRFLIKGGHGSGKTILSVYRGIGVAKETNKKVVLLQSESDKKNLLINQTSEISDFQKNVSVLTWEEWLEFLFLSHGMSVLKNGNEYDWNSIISAVRMFNENIEHLIIDDIQDMPLEMANIVALCANSIMCFCLSDSSISKDWLRLLCIECPYFLEDNVEELIEKSNILRPGGALMSRPCKVIFLRDISARMKSMDNKKLEQTINSLLSDMKEAEDENPYTHIIVKTLCIGDKAYWQNTYGEDLSSYIWRMGDNQGAFNVSEAFSTLEKEISVENMSSQVLPPVIILITNSEPTMDYMNALENLRKMPWFKKAIKVGVIDNNCSEGTYELAKQFTGNLELVLRPDDINCIAKLFWIYPS